MGKRSRRSALLARVLGLQALLLVSLGRAQDNEVDEPLQLSSIEEIRDLSRQEAELTPRASFEATVTLWWRERGLVFVQDGAYGIYMNDQERRFEFDEGDRLHIEGVVSPGEFLPIVNPVNIEKIGEEARPDPAPLDVETVLAHSYDSDWVECEALVWSISKEDGYAEPPLYRLEMISVGVRVDCLVPVSGLSEQDMDALRLKKLRIRGVGAKEHSEPRARHMTIYTPEFSYIEETGLQISERAGWGAMRRDNLRDDPSPVRLIGRIGIKGENGMVIQNRDQVLFVDASNQTDWRTGATVEVFGGPYLWNGLTWMWDARLSASDEEVVVDVLDVEPRQLNELGYFGRTVRLTGQFISKFTGEGAWEGKLFRAENRTFEVMIAEPELGPETIDLLEDATYEITGVLSPGINSLSENPRIRVASAQDIRYTKAPPVPAETLLSIVVPLLIAVLLMLVLSLFGVFRTQRIAARLRESEARLKEVNEWLERKVDSGATALRVSSSTLSVAMDSSSDALLVCTRESVIQTFNQSFRDMWDLPSSVKPGGSAEVAALLVSGKVSSPEDFMGRTQEILARDHESSFDTLWLKDGRIIEQISRPRYVDGQPAGRVWSFRDVTAREEQRLRVEGIVTSAMDAIVGVDSERRIELLNPAAERLFGRPEAELKGVPLDEALAIEENSVERNGHAIEVPAAAGSGRVRKGDGTTVPVEMTQFTTRVGNRSMGAYFLRDVSQRIEAEKRRRELEAELRQTQKMQAISSLAGGVAHDFNNIIGAIILNARYLKDEVSGSNSLSEVVDDILSSSQQAKELVTEVLTFSRQDDAVKTRIDLAKVVRSSLSEIRPRIPQNVRLKTEGLDGAAIVHGNETQLRQVVSNLGINAIHAMEDMGGDLIISLSRMVEGASAHGPGSRSVSYVVSVSDTGCGVPEDVRERLFEPFFTTKEPGKGTGLGLAVVHGVVEGHGGRVEVESELGAGATFRVFLPADSIRA